MLDLDKYLLPWIIRHDLNSQNLSRPKLTGSFQCSIRVNKYGKWEYDDRIRIGIAVYPTKEEAIRRKDEELLFRGFVFLTEEQAAKFRALL